MTINKIYIPKYVENKEQIEHFIWWVDDLLSIESIYVSVSFRRYLKHKNPKNNRDHGWCTPNDKTGDLDVIINTAHCTSFSDILQTLAHEFIHVNQHDKDYFIYQEFESPDYDYETDPNEIEAWSKMGDIVAEFYK
jgi:hypothetical protein